MTDDIAQTELTRQKPSPEGGSIDSSNQATAGNDSAVKKHTDSTGIPPVEKPAATPDTTLEGSSEKLARQSMTEQSMTERATKPSNPLEMPYDNVSPDSEEYRDWRKVQHRHGMRNLILALVVFGSLAALYWIFIHNA